MLILGEPSDILHGDTCSQPKMIKDVLNFLDSYKEVLSDWMSFVGHIHTAELWE